MAFAWVKKLGTPYVEDPIFRENFFKDFCEELKVPYTQEINFDQLIFEVQRRKAIKEHLTRKEKKEGIEERKKLREKRKKKYGYALVDGKRVEVSNYIAEPSSLFMGKGENPLRGHFKRGPRKEDIVLNLSPNAKCPPGKWKKIVWKPNKMWIASWTDKLTGKQKYVWLGDSYHKKQEREKKKFEKAKTLDKNFWKVKAYILKNLTNKDLFRKKIATVCYLISKLNIRVGDEHEEGEADTVGAITLRPEHISLPDKLIHSRELVSFSFIGKDSVKWKIVLPLDSRAIKNLRFFSTHCKKSLFEGITSKDISKFLNEIQRGLTAKVFRTWKISQTVKEYLDERVLKKSDPEWLKILTIKFANLQGAIVANHKRKIPVNYEKRILKKKEKFKKLSKDIHRLKGKGKDITKKVDQLTKLGLTIDFIKASKEYTLSTSLRSYIDPRIIKSYCDKIDLPYEKVYSKALLRKFSWCLG